MQCWYSLPKNWLMILRHIPIHPPLRVGWLRNSSTFVNSSGLVHISLNRTVRGSELVFNFEYMVFFLVLGAYSLLSQKSVLRYQHSYLPVYLTKYLFHLRRYCSLLSCGIICSSYCFGSIDNLPQIEN